MDKKEKCPEPGIPDMQEKEQVPQAPDNTESTGGLSETLDALEAALEKPLLPVWGWYKSLGNVKKFTVSFFAVLIAVCLAFLCFLPGILHTIDKNRAAEATLQQAMLEEEAAKLAAEQAAVAGPTQKELLARKIAERKHSVLTQFFSTDFCIQLRSCSITLTPAQLSEMYDLEETSISYNFIPDCERIKAFITECCELNEPDPIAVKYVNTAKTRDSVSVPGKETGFIPDIDKAADMLATMISSGHGGTVEMEYSGSAFCDSLWRKFKGTGLEVSIDNQYLWLYFNGKVVAETPIVSGNVWTGDSTPKGKFLIYWMTTDTYLKGATWNDFVSYWAPFYGNYGIHDAQWRDEFGGDIYLHDGSHGCINVPHDAMREIFNYMYVKMPIVVY